MMTPATIDTFNIDDDLQEMRLMQEERQLRLLEALHAMENNMMSDEDMAVIWFECGMPRAAFRKLN
jgi:hypothetical protein